MFCIEHMQSVAKACAWLVQADLVTISCIWGLMTTICAPAVLQSAFTGAWHETESELYEKTSRWRLMVTTDSTVQKQLSDQV